MDNTCQVKWNSSHGWGMNFDDVTKTRTSIIFDGTQAIKLIEKQNELHFEC